MSPSASDELSAWIRRCWQARVDLADQTTAYRIAHGAGEGRPGVAIDRCGETAIIWHAADRAGELDALVAGLDACHRFSTIVRKTPGAHPQVLRCDDVDDHRTTRVVELGNQFIVEPAAPTNPGLYLDARPARAWVAANTRGRRVLNMFAFTGSFGVAALAGGARSVTHVDSQKRALRRARANHAANAQHIDDRDLIRDDAYRFLRSTAKTGRSFDAIVLDPPPRVAGAPDQDYKRLVPLALALLQPAGWLLCSLQRRGVASDVFVDELLVAASRQVDVVWRGASGIDFPEERPENKVRFVALARRGIG